MITGGYPERDTPLGAPSAGPPGARLLTLISGVKHAALYIGVIISGNSLFGDSCERADRLAELGPALRGRWLLHDRSLEAQDLFTGISHAFVRRALAGAA